MMATRTPDPFASALHALRSANAERRALRLTPPAPPPPRDSDPQAGEALPELGRAAAVDTDSDRPAALPPSVAAWAWSEGDSNDGRTGR